jgi:Zn-dependent protease with chaperone function
MLAKDLRTPRERTLFAISAIFSSLAWLALLVSIVGFVAGAVLAALALAVRSLRLAPIVGNGVRTGPRQLPDLQRRIEAAAHKLGLTRPPRAYVMQSGRRLGAFAMRILSRRFIVIDPDLIDACGGGGAAGGAAGGELDFIIGHELGHFAAGHLARRFFLLPARLVPLLGAAFARACAYTADRCGHAVTDDLATSSRALAILAAGPAAARRMDLDAYVEQRRETATFWMAVYELNSAHPFLSKRVAALRDWQHKGSVEPVGRNPFAYLLAPFFALATGGPPAALLIVLVCAGIVAAVGIPRIKQQLGQLGLGKGAVDHYRLDADPARSDPFPPP